MGQVERIEGGIICRGEKGEEGGGRIKRIN